MQLDRETGGGNVIRSFTAGELRINNETFNSPVLVSAESVTLWTPADLDDLSIADFSDALRLQPEVILLGTGMTQQFPDMALITEIMRSGVGFEVMDTGAACRTFNVLTGEQRQVIAALLIR